jgi:hypothetical protein
VDKREFKYQCDTGSRITILVSRTHLATAHKRHRPRQPHRPVRRNLDAQFAAGHLHGDGAGAAAGADGRLNTLIYILSNLRFLQRLRRNPALNAQKPHHPDATQA